MKEIAQLDLSREIGIVANLHVAWVIVTHDFAFEKFTVISPVADFAIANRTVVSDDLDIFVRHHVRPVIGIRRSTYLLCAWAPGLNSRIS